jgi:hypothetical protein
MANRSTLCSQFMDALEAYVQERIREHQHNRHDEPGGISVEDKRADLEAAIEQVLDFVPRHHHISGNS